MRRSIEEQNRVNDEFALRLQAFNAQFERTHQATEHENNFTQNCVNQPKHNDTEKQE